MFKSTDCPFGFQSPTIKRILTKKLHKISFFLVFLLWGVLYHLIVTKLSLTNHFCVMVNTAGRFIAPRIYFGVGMFGTKCLIFPL